MVSTTCISQVVSRNPTSMLFQPVSSITLRPDEDRSMLDEQRGSRRRRGRTIRLYFLLLVLAAFSFNVLFFVQQTSSLEPQRNRATAILLNLRSSAVAFDRNTGNVCEPSRPLAVTNQKPSYGGLNLKFVKRRKILENRLEKFDNRLPNNTALALECNPQNTSGQCSKWFLDCNRIHEMGLTTAEPTFEYKWLR